MILGIERQRNCMNFLDQGLKKKYLNLFLNKTFDIVSMDYFKYNIEAKLLSKNLTNRFFEMEDSFDFIVTAFLIQDKALQYYKNKKNDTMILFMQQSILESHIMYLEGDYIGSENTALSFSENLIIESIVEKSI